MDTTITLLLLLAGIAGGIINAVAGGATLITFPVMLAAGLPPVIANASNAVAIAPGHLLAAIADREKMPALDGYAEACSVNYVPIRRGRTKIHEAVSLVECLGVGLRVELVKT